jgi:hypothetical protein
MITMQYISVPVIGPDIKNPEVLDEAISYQTAQIPKIMPALKEKIPDLADRLPRYKRDLIYLSEVSQSQEDINFCIALALRMNFGVWLEHDALSMSTPVNSILMRRAADLVRCCDSRHLDLHPILKTYLV